MDDAPSQGPNNEGILMDITSAESRQHSLDDQNQQTHSQNSDSGTVLDDKAIVSDSESGNSGANSRNFQYFYNGLVRLSEGDRFHDLIKVRLLAGLGLLGKQATVVEIHKNMYSGALGQAKLQSFQILSEAMEKKCGGDANVKFAWFGARSRDEICNIMNHGFGPQVNDNSGLYGCGIYLSSDYSPLESARSLRNDKDGLRHLLLCRVILGKTEVVRPGSDQDHPSSEEFDSGIDTFPKPHKYIVWSTNMNTHILPEFVISFKAPPSMKGFFKSPESPDEPTSPWMPFAALISALSEFLPGATVNLLDQFHKDYKVKKIISRQELVHRVRQIAGDGLLIAVIRSYRAKQLTAKKLSRGRKDVNGDEGKGSMD